MRLGILTFGGGNGAAASERQGRLAAWLEAQDHRVVPGENVVVSDVSAAGEAQRLVRAHCDAVVFLVEGDCAPDLCLAAALHLSAPILLLGDAVSPAVLWGFAGALREIGLLAGRVLGDPDAADAQGRIARWLGDHDPNTRQRGEDAAQKLYGTRFGAFVAPATGADAGQWLSQFGVQIRHFDTATLQQRAGQVDHERAEGVLSWLGNHCGEIAYDGHALTRGLHGTLAHQARLYLALRDLCAEHGIDFCALPDRVTTDDGQTLSTALPRALLGDGADREPAKPLVCAPGGDANGALTLKLLHLVSGAPALSAELSRRDAASGRFDREEGGGHPPRFAEPEGEPAESWRRVTLRPARNANGAEAHFPVPNTDAVTFARITRRSGRLVATLLRGALLAEAPQIRLDCPFERLAQAWLSRRIHAVSGDHLAALIAACEALDIETIVLEEP